jgi:hypothetical protein
MPGRFGPRFALEAGFLILLAVAAGFAHLRPTVIVLVMAAAWVLVALLEFIAERIATMLPFRVSYVRGSEAPEEEIEPEPAPAVTPAVTPPVTPPEETTEEATLVVRGEAEGLEPPRRRRWFSRRRKEEAEAAEVPGPAPQPRHVRLLPPQRSDTSPAAAEVAEIFDDGERDERAQ